MLPFTEDELKRAVYDKRVTARRHNVYPYTIYNYSDEVQFSRQWDKVTLNCRGLILDDNFNIVARPWQKFFNLGETNLPIQFDDPVEVMDKVDGSLGILYPVDPFNAMNDFAIATRGSFHSEQAEHATQLWRDKYNYWADENYTFLFEIIYRGNRIVLDYGDMDDLVLLGAVEKTTGHYVSPLVAKNMFYMPSSIHPTEPVEWVEFPNVVEVFDYNTISQALDHVERPNAEGYVLRSHNFMVKIKQNDYLELHRLRYNMTPKRIWEALSTGRSLEEIVAPLPDEFQDEILAIGNDLEIKWVAVAVEASKEFSKYRHLVDDRKAFAKAAQKSPHRAALFMFLDGRRDKLYKYYWDQVKPNGD